MVYEEGDTIILDSGTTTKGMVKNVRGKQE